MGVVVGIYLASHLLYHGSVVDDVIGDLERTNGVKAEIT